MRTLNVVNGADKLCEKYEKACLKEFEEELIGVIMGIAYGGDVERIARDVWGSRGKVYGYDVFEATHPKHLAEDRNDFDATCMDHWYMTYGTEELAYTYQRNELDRQGLTNAFLIKGEVSPESCKDLPYINYAFLDMDIVKSMAYGYQAVREKIVPGGYLLLHDVYQNIPQLGRWYEDDVKNSGLWEVVEEACLTGVLRRKRE